MDDPHLANLLGALALGVTDELLVASAAAGVGWSEAAGIASIATRPGESIEQLAAVLGLSHSGTVRLVDRLEAGGLAERQRTEHARTVRVVPTPAGLAAADELLRLRRQACERVLTALMTREQQQLKPLLMRLLGALPDDRSEARHLCRLCEHRVCHDRLCPVGSAVDRPTVEPRP